MRHEQRRSGARLSLHREVLQGLSAGAKLLIKLWMAGNRRMLDEMGVPLCGSRRLVPEDRPDFQQVRAVLSEQRCAGMAPISPAR
jgi:hypothetical protein